MFNVPCMVEQAAGTRGPALGATRIQCKLQVSSTTGRIYTYLTTAQTYSAANDACKALTFPGVTGKGYLVSLNKGKDYHP